jgi:adenosylcobinamide-GDP ribazoletransferase
VAAIGVVLLLRTGCVAALLARPDRAVLVGLAVATAAGRTAVPWACRRGVPAARPEGLGALVAGAVPAAAAVAGTALVAALGGWAVPGRWWQGPLAVLAALGVAELARRHATRRLGGITGDALGAVVELAAVLCLVGLAFQRA